MTITTSCPTCMSLFRLPAEFAGRQVRCQKCENTFLVPEFSPGTMETTAGLSAAPVEESAPVQQPLERPLVADPVEQAPPKVAATPSPPIEIVEDEPAPPPSAKPVEAPAVEPPKSAPPVLVPSPVPPRWAGLVSLAALFFVGLLAMSASIWWVARHLDARRTTSTNRNAPISSRAIPIEFGSDGRLSVIGQTRPPDFMRDETRWRHDGPFELYAIHLEQGKTYNFSVSGATITPRLQVYDGRFTHADRSGIVPENKMMLGYQPKQTGSHLLFITSSQRIAGDFILSVAVQRGAVSPLFDLAEQPSVTAKDTLGLEHALGVDVNSSGVYREYRVMLERNREYSISLASDEFHAKVHVFDRNNQAMEFIRPWNQPLNKNHTFFYRPNLTGEHRVRVTGDRFGLGAFTLRIADTSNVRPVQSVLVVFQNGVFEDRRSFVPFDPNEPTKPGLGPYKEYVVRLDGKQRYRIESKSTLFATTITVHNEQAQLVAGDIGLRNQPLEFTPAVGGQYHIRVIGENRRARGEYQLRIEQLP